jgi:hypothetical protein
MKLLIKILKFKLILLILFTGFRVNNIALAQKLSSTDQESLSNLNLELNLPPKDRPGGRNDGSERDLCPQVEIGLTALIPQTNIGLTTSESPSFWFYIPYPKNTNISGEFSLWYEDPKTLEDTYIDIQKINLVNTPGIVQINLAQPLETNKSYRWQFKLNCGGSNDYTWVFGQVERVTLNSEIQNQLATATLGEKLEIYAAQGLWFDLLNTIGQLYYANPKNETIKQLWQNLLTEVDLENITNKPLK